MAPPVRSVFCLGLWLAQVVRARHGPLPRPTLQALPSALVPLGSLVTLRCRGPPGVDLYRLEQLGTRRYSDQDVLVIPALDRSSVGRYRCSYQHGSRWSPASEVLELVAVGVFEKPRLSAIPGPVVRSGEDVTLQCQTRSGFDQFALSKEGQAQPRKEHDRWYQASFSLVTVTAAHSGVYRCYSFSSSSPYLWSAPSDPLQLVVTGTFPKPSIWAKPGPVVAMGSSVTIWCQATRQAEVYRLYKDGAFLEETWAQQDSTHRAGFLIGPANSYSAGQYHCDYQASFRISQASDILIVVVTGLYRAPSLSAQPSPVVALGGTVSLSCSSDYSSDLFYLLKERGAGPIHRQDSSYLNGTRTWQTTFRVGPVNSTHGGIYRCYSSPYSTPLLWSLASSPLELQVTGALREPSLSAHPASLLLPGQSLTLRCHCEPGCERFALTHDKGHTAPPQRLVGQRSPDFPLGPVYSSVAGQYRCYGGRQDSSMWSAPSAPLDILVAGMFQKPRLQAQPGPSVPQGAAVALRCGSDEALDTFLLHREGSDTPPQRLRVQGTATPAQVTFTLSPVTSAHEGTYRCYGSHSNDTYLWSHPSDPLQLEVSGGAQPSSPSPPQPGSPTAPQPQDHTVENLIRLGVAGLVLLLLGLLLLEAWLSARRTRGTAAGHPGRGQPSLLGLQALCAHSRSTSGTMGVGTKTPALIGLLCLGLCWGPWDEAQAQAGTLPKPSIWAQPGPVVANGSSVTIWCQATPQAEFYHLYKDGTFLKETQAQQDSTHRAGFLIRPANSYSAGQYQCVYHTSLGLSQASDPLTVVVTGLYRAPSLSARPSPVVALGGTVSLSCSSGYSSGLFYLLKEGGAGPIHRQESRYSYESRTWQTTFRVGPVNSTHGGIYRCYSSASYNPLLWSLASSPLELQVTGVFREPSLSAHPASLLLPGQSLTLRCHCEPGCERFALTQDKGHTAPPQRLVGQHSPDFPLGPVYISVAGQYRCYGGRQDSSMWSAPSAPLDILVAGMFQKPWLQEQPGPSVPQGAAVALRCGSDEALDTFLLHREGSDTPPQRLRVQGTDTPAQVTFTLSPVTSAHEGTYRCYGSHSSDPYLWSYPSDPLQLEVSGLYRAPSLSAQPSPVVALGGTVSLSCSSDVLSGPAHLLKEGGAGLIHRQESRYSYESRTWQTTFRVGPVNSTHGGIYRCYSSASNNPLVWSLASSPLELQVTGVLRKPSLSAHPASPLSLPGKSLTLRCHCESSCERFALTQDKWHTAPPQRLVGQHSPDFPLGPVSSSVAGQYRCYGGRQDSSMWSAPSAALDVLVAGMFQKPRLQAQPGPSVPQGAAVALRCGSDEALDTFLLHREGSDTPPQRLRVQGTATPAQVTFTLSPVTSAHEGTYRCYGSHSSDPYLWSHPSDPLQLEVSGGPKGSLPSPTDPDPRSGLLHPLKILLGVSVVSFLLLCLFLLLLFVFIRKRHHRQHKSGAEPRHQALPKSASPAAEAQESLYAAVTPTEAEEMQLDIQVAEGLQEVTYAELSHGASQQTATSPLPQEPSTYAALAVHQPGTVPGDQLGCPHPAASLR
ncbi:leukocyte immunoglobulin-like receptor subfamily B member 3 [Ochotona curzoniae]|uniref:leukocyte immunoglobulin-like receptor subfamily B member 3 n=1 Tax=Ochotona curzoniae TaxID=130825 RepID=UPI001B34BCA1|nr:leukocyte immunoglobulin-like receptor subfamily B member 3 [Ochotona curzoniae]